MYEPISRDHARELVELMVRQFQPSSFRPGGATWGQLMRKSGMKESTYQRALDCCTEHEWLVGGGGRNLKYYLNPSGKWQEAFESFIQQGMKEMEAKDSPSSEASWGLSESDSHLALLSEALQHIDEKKR